MRRPVRSHRPLRDERGFTLTEILVCLLIVGILAAIALPAWVNQRDKGEDTEAKSALRTAAVALHTYSTQHNTYDATVEELETIEPALGEARGLEVDGTDDGYELSVDSINGTEFTLIREPDGNVVRDCSRHGRGLCRPAADSNGDFW